MLEIIYSILSIIVILAGATAIAYFYFSTDIFADILKKPLRIISIGMLVINVGILSIAYLSYESSRGVTITLGAIPLSTFFYSLYFIGSIIIIFGSHKFTRRINSDSSSVSTSRGNTAS